MLRPNRNRENPIYLCLRSIQEQILGIESRPTIRQCQLILQKTTYLITTGDCPAAVEGSPFDCIK